MPAIHWLRRDIRLKDNPALHAALHYGAVVSVFILDPHLISRTPKRRQDFLFSGLRELDAQLKLKGSRLILRSGEPQVVLEELLAESQAQTIIAEEDFTPYARSRDARIKRQLPMQLIDGQTVHHPASVLKSNGNPFIVFTPYSNAWKALLPAEINLLPIPNEIPSISNLASEPIPSSETESNFPGGEKEAKKRLSGFIKKWHPNIQRPAQPHGLGGNLLPIAISEIWDDIHSDLSACRASSGLQGEQRIAAKKYRNLGERINLARILYPDPVSLPSRGKTILQSDHGRYPLAQQREGV